MNPYREKKKKQPAKIVSFQVGELSKRTRGVPKSRRGMEPGIDMVGYLALMLLGTESKNLSPRRPRSSMVSRLRFLKLVGRGGEMWMSARGLLVPTGLVCSSSMLSEASCFGLRKSQPGENGSRKDCVCKDLGWELRRVCVLYLCLGATDVTIGAALAVVACHCCRSVCRSGRSLRFDCGVLQRNNRR